jgi:hypothetical protein
MLSHRWRPVWYCGIGVILTWSAALTGFNLARKSRPTAEAVRAYVESVDFSKLTPTQRSEEIQTLAAKLNKLPIDERRRAQFERIPNAWFNQMTEAEKRQLLEAITPPGLAQVLAAFEKLPEDRRRRTIEDTVRRLRQSQSRLETMGVTNSLPPMTGVLQARIRSMDLVDFYEQSPAQTKADLAPILEELQRVMESGRPFRGR